METYITYISWFYLSKKVLILPKITFFVFKTFKKLNDNHLYEKKNNSFLFRTKIIKLDNKWILPSERRPKHVRSYSASI